MKHSLSNLPFMVALAAVAACGDDSDEDPIEDTGSASTALPESSEGGGSTAAADSTSDGGVVDVDELASCPEDDLSVMPFAGPAFDPETGELLEPLPLPHVVATTAGWPQADGWELLGMQSNLVIADVFTRDGLLGATFGISNACGSARTITVWRDEAAMMAFVAGEAHMTAIQAALPSTKAWETTQWSETTDDQPPTWQRVRDELDVVRP